MNLQRKEAKNEIPNQHSDTSKKHNESRDIQHTCSPSNPIIFGIDGPQMSTSSSDTWKRKEKEKKQITKTGTRI